MTPSSPARTKVFIAYHHRDEASLIRLRVHLALLIRKGQVSLWDDTSISPGDDWRLEIAQALQITKVAVLLLSGDFIGSDFIYEHMLQPLLLAAQIEAVTLLPILLKPCMYEDTPLEALRFVNDDRQPLIDKTEAQQEAIWVKTARTIGELLRIPVSPPLEAQQPASSRVGRIIVILEDHNHNSSRRANVDVAIPVSELARQIVRALGMADTDASGRPQIYRLSYNGRRLQDHESLASAKVTELDTITVIPETSET